MAKVSAELNEEDNIGARRLRTVMDAVMEEINFEAPDLKIDDGQTIVITKEYVIERTKSLYQNRDYRLYVI
jgi:ATP-dependent HslUV protease ATP-binding subunit HslU